jgi:hypothetical protein
VSSLATEVSELDDPKAPSAEQQRILLQGLAEPGVDTGAAATRVAELRLARRSRRLVLGGASAVLLILLLIGSWTLLRDPTPDSVLADKSEESALRVTSTTTTAPQGLQTAPQSSTVPPLATIPVTTAVLVAPPLSPESTVAAAPSTLAPLRNQPMTAELVVSTSQIEAGSVIEATVRWSDPDLALGYVAPHQIQNWGDPVLAPEVTPTTVQSCDTAGSPARGETISRFSYSTPGQYTLRVILDTCAGQGGYSERVERTQLITVLPARYSNPTDPDSQDVAGQAVVVSWTTPQGQAPYPALSSAQAEYIASSPASVRLPIRVNPAVQQFTSSGPAAVFVVPLDAAGRIVLSFPDSSVCATTDEFPAVLPGSATPVLQLRTVPCP